MKVAVVGSGIVGLATAYRLAERGCEVVVVADRPAGRGASISNAGWIVPALSGPVPAPGLVLQAMKWMLRPDSPVYVRPSLKPSFLRFMLGMARACTAPAFNAAFAATAALGQGTMDELDRWVADGLMFELHADGELQVYVEPADLRRATADVARYERAGFDPEVLTGDEARALVPQLSPEVLGAIRFPNERSVRPASLIGALGDRLAALGVARVDGAVTSGRAPAGGGVELGGPFGRLGADAVVIAAGAWSGAVTRLFGAPLPVRPGKGYSVDYVPAPLPMAMPLMLAEAHSVMTPLEGGLRLAGTMEFGGFDERVSARRVAALRQAPSRYLAGWRPDAAAEPPAAGLRPMTPDGLPVIGRLRDAPAVLVASGHAMLGMTLAPRTATLLAGMLLDGDEPEVLRPFSPRRFGV